MLPPFIIFQFCMSTNKDTGLEERIIKRNPLKNNLFETLALRDCGKD